MQQTIPAAGQSWVNDFTVEKSDSSVTVKVFPDLCGTDVPRIAIQGWKSDKDNHQDDDQGKNCTSSSANITCVKMMESRNCSSSSNESTCFEPICTTELVEICDNRTLLITGQNCTGNNNNSSNVTTLALCQNKTRASVVQDCRHENVTTCKEVIKTKNCSKTEGNCTHQAVVKVCKQQQHLNQSSCKEHQTQKNGSSMIFEETPNHVAYEDPANQDSIVVVSTVEVPSAPVSGHFVLKYTTEEGESFYTKSTCIDPVCLFKQTECFALSDWLIINITPCITKCPF